MRESLVLTRHRTKKSSFAQFLDDFAAEIDLFDGREYPEWVHKFREKLLKPSKLEKTVCEYLKTHRIEFKFKLPVEKEGRFKFADFYLPAHDTVILLLSSYKELTQICHKDPERVLFFKDTYKVIQIYDFDKDRIDEILEVIVQ